MIAQPLNYSGNSSRSIVGHFRSPEPVAGLSLSFLLDHLHGPLPTARPRNPSLHSASAPRALPKVVPNPTRVVVTVGSGSSPNIYKTSPFFFLVSETADGSLSLSSLSLRPSAQSSTHYQDQPNLSRQPAALLARASEKLSRTRPEQSSPLGPDHPLTSTKRHHFLIWTPSLFFSTARL